MRKMIIRENQIGIKSDNGIVSDILKAGVYWILNETKTAIDIYEMDGFISKDFPLEIALKHSKLAEMLEVFDVLDSEVGLIFEDQRLKSVVSAGRYVAWKAYHEYSLVKIDITEPEVDKKYSKYMTYPKVQPYINKYAITQGCVGVMSFQGKITKLLEPGEYYFWRNSKTVSVAIVDMRQQQLEISGQELLTEDRVSIRMNLVCQYRIVDVMKTMDIKDLSQQIYVTVQLAIREYVGGYKFDELMLKKDEVAGYILEKVHGYEEAFGIEFINAGIKDIILPGDIKEIFNSVLIAEKKAQANVITRREEVASTRSLLNTAKLMDENRTLYQLKEMEYLERICDHIGDISVSGNGNILEMLRSLIEEKKH